MCVCVCVCVCVRVCACVCVCVCVCACIQSFSMELPSVCHMPDPGERAVNKPAASSLTGLALQFGAMQEMKQGSVVWSVW